MSIRANFDPRRADQVITFQRNFGTQSDSGDVREDWRDVIETRAAVDGQKGSEIVAGGGIKGRCVYTVWVAADIIARFNIGAVDRILWLGQPLNMEPFADQQLAGRWVPIVCTTGVNAG